MGYAMLCTLILCPIKLLSVNNSEDLQFRRHFSLAPWASQHLFLSDDVIIRIFPALNTQNCTESQIFGIFADRYLSEWWNSIKSQRFDQTEQMVLSEQPGFHFHRQQLNHCHHRGKNRSHCTISCKEKFELGKLSVFVHLVFFSITVFTESGGGTGLF